ncbi:MAG: SLC13 family permease [Synergistaceae bacterium]|jgi:di/tricarboxylate transporter|nr:SLC13 family permease [Synergistaceae bacterium]
MGKNKPLIGFVIGIVVALLIANVEISNIERAGQLCMAFSFMTVIFWAFQITQAGYISVLYLMLLCVFKVAEPQLVFSTWAGSFMYTIIGAYLIAGAVKDSGLGERIAYKFLLSFVSSFKSIIIAIFALTFILSLLIPHPWPRAFLIMSVMAVIIKSANIPKEDAVKIGFTVFAASVPVSLIFLTGDAVISPLAIQTSGQQLSWLGWFKLMGPPSIVASLLSIVMILYLFKPTKELRLNRDEIKAKLDSLGSMSSVEKRTTFWIALAIILWMTDSIHGQEIGWVTIFIAICMSMPLIGGILTVKSWGGVPIHVLLFLTAAVAIGRVGGVTGMNVWVANTILPSTVPQNPFILAAFISTVSIIIHMLLGSVIAVMGIVIPAMLAFTSSMGINSLIPALMAYTAVASHYVLPFQHLNMLVGLGDDNGMYTQKETIRFGIPFIVVIYIVTVAIEVPWWKICGLW